MTINEIAKLSGVSRATVSRYLNDGYVSEENRANIKRVIAETGYVPSSQAQNLRSKKTKLIGVIIPKINSDTVSRMVSGISEVLKESGYELLLGNASNDVNEELRLLELFQENKVDGVIFSASIFTTRHKQLLKKYKIPIVIMGQRLEGYSCVYNDDYYAVRSITSQLLKHGNNPCYIGVTQKDIAVGSKRQKGFMDALKESDMDCEESRILEADFNETSGYEMCRKMFERDSNRDILVCATDNIALGAIKYLNETGKKVPEDVQVSGVGDTYICKWVTPSLTSVHLYYKTCGMEAAGMMLEKLEKNSKINKEMKMSYELVLRGTSK